MPVTVQRPKTKQLGPHDQLLRQLARLHGIQPVYRDEAGTLRIVPRASLRTLLSLLGTPASTASQVKKALAESQHKRWSRLVDEMLVLHQSDLSAGFTLHLPVSKQEISAATITYEIRGQSHFHARRVFKGTQLAIQARKRLNGKQFIRVQLPFPRHLPCGYFTLRVVAQSPAVSCEERGRLIITPDKAFCPSALQRGRRMWGLTVQLYGLRTTRNWGIGDFGDL